MDIRSNHKVLGSYSDKMGDAVLSMTRDVMDKATTFLSAFVGPDSNASKDYSTLLLFYNPASSLYSIVHYQAEFTKFPQENRWYDTRALYELNTDDFKKVNYSYNRIIDSLSLMKEYSIYDREPYPGVQATNSSRHTLIEEEKLICKALKCALVSGKQVYVQLGEQDKLYGDAVRKSKKLATILGGIDLMPSSFHPYISLIFAAENNSPGISWVAPYLSIIAHFDSLESWGKEANDVIEIDWQGESPIPKGCQDTDIAWFEILNPKEAKTFSNVPTFEMLSDGLKNVRKKLESYITTYDKLNDDELGYLIGIWNKRDTLGYNDGVLLSGLIRQFLLGNSIDETIINGLSSTMVKEQIDLIGTKRIDLNQLSKLPNNIQKDSSVIDALLKDSSDIEHLSSLYTHGWESLQEMIINKCWKDKELCLSANEQHKELYNALKKKFDSKLTELPNNTDKLNYLIQWDTSPIFGKENATGYLTCDNWKQFCDWVKRIQDKNILLPIPEWESDGELEEDAYNYFCNNYQNQKTDLITKKLIPQYNKHSGQSTLLNLDDLLKDDWKKLADQLLDDCLKKMRSRKS